MLKAFMSIIDRLFFTKDLHLFHPLIANFNSFKSCFWSFEFNPANASAWAVSNLGVTIEYSLLPRSATNSCFVFPTCFRVISSNFSIFVMI